MTQSERVDATFEPRTFEMIQNQRLSFFRLIMLCTILIAVIGQVAIPDEASAGGTAQGPLILPSPQEPQIAITTIDELARLSPEALLMLYRSGRPAIVPIGEVRGLPITLPGKRISVFASKAGRVVWQGKIFEPGSGQAVNRFFGLSIIRGNLGYGPSKLDGHPALILDYDGTSILYGRYRDEIREVAPGILLGLMYDRDSNNLLPRRFFAIETN